MRNFESFPPLQNGYTPMAAMNGVHANMLMDMGIQAMKAGETVTLRDEDKEVAFLLIDGSVRFECDHHVWIAERKSLFDETPSCLHVPANAGVRLTAIADAQVLIAKTTNETAFPVRWYAAEETDTQIFGLDVWSNTAKRAVRTVFDYSNAPWSNLVVGEVINLPGRWSSYIPHHHTQPEIYYYRFDKPQGFGCCIIGEDVHKITDNAIACIPGGLVHPQVTAPGYAMYYCWIIRHLPGNPWTSRTNDPQHEWLLQPDADIWQAPEDGI